MKFSVFIVVTVVALSGVSTSRCSKDSDNYADTENHLCGAYTSQREITDEEMALFESVIGTIDTVEYTPLSVATQVVAGINYRFHCRYCDRTDASTGFCFVTIYVPLQGDPQLTDVEKL